MWKLFDVLFPPRTDDLVLRDVSDGDFFAHLDPQLVPITHPATVALFSFSYPAVRAAIHEAKYHGSERAFSMLARSLEEYLRDADDTGSAPIILPMPLGNERRIERGFNQSEEIARRALAGCSASVDTSLIIRVRDTASQVSLPKEERKKNMLHAFSSSKAADPRATYIIFDDVLTTGATMQAAIDALTDAGAMHILPIALAR